MPTILDEETSLLRDARGMSTTLVGNTASTVGTQWPQTDKVQVGDRIFLRGVVPRALDKRPISISCESNAGIIATVCVSPADPSNVEIPGIATRDHYALITFGSANGNHKVELDVCVGNAVSIPAATIQVEFFDETPRPTLNGVEPRAYPTLTDSVSVSHLTRSGVGFRTRRVWIPYFLNAAIDATSLAAVVADVIANPGPAIRSIPPFVTHASVITASLALTTTAALILLGRDYSVVGISIWGFSSAALIFSAGRMVIPQAAEFFVLATNIPYPVAPLEGSNLFWSRFDLEF